MNGAIGQWDMWYPTTTLHVARNRYKFDEEPQVAENWNIFSIRNIRDGRG